MNKLGFKSNGFSPIKLCLDGSSESCFAPRGPRLASGTLSEVDPHLLALDETTAEDASRGRTGRASLFVERLDFNLSASKAVAAMPAESKR
jgi:hypothetical protein